ncbi:MAG: MFS transporter [Coxiellaceae bacterium]|nr:MFS transporter [Coxiellaceae bacterium]
MTELTAKHTLSDSQHESYVAHPWRAWVVVLTAGLFFFYEFIQMNMFDAISGSLIHEFGITAGRLGQLSSYYFIANVVFLFPAGMLLDRYSTRIVILVSMGVCVLGTTLLSFAPDMSWAIASRFLTGIGSAFCFLSGIRLASRWFEPRHMALVTGILVTMAMVGGMLAQTPMSILVAIFSWRETLLLDALMGIILMLVIASIVRDYPEGSGELIKVQEAEAEKMGFWSSLRLAFGRWQNWMAGVYACLMNLPLSLLGGLYGAMYLKQSYGLNQMHATNVVSMLFLGTIIGAPLMGWLSDKWQRRRSPMLIAALVSFAFMLLVVYSHGLNYGLLITLFFMVGFFTSAQVLSYPWVAENSLTVITAMSVSVVNISVQGGQAIFQPLFGYLLDRHAAVSGYAVVSSSYSTADFRSALLLPAIGFVAAFVAAYLIKESYCRHIEDSADIPNT